MKKKFLLIMLAIVSALCLAFGLTACGGGRDNAEEDTWTMNRLYAKAQELGFEGTLDELIDMFKGDKGDDGEDGKDGVGIKSVEIDGRGHLMVTLTDGTVLDAGWVPTSGSTCPEVVDGTEGLAYQKLKDEDGNAYAAVTGLGMAWETDIVIPFTYRGLPVKKILAQAFNGSENSRHDYNKNITSISIPASVTEIGEDAFSDCLSLKSVTFEGDSQLTSIGSQAFEYCTSLISITIPAGVTSIGSSAFSGCSGLTSIKIPDSVTSIGNWAFSGCYGLTSVTIGSGVTSIGGAAFAYCSGLTSVIIGSGVTSIGDRAFEGCTSLESINFGESSLLEYIGSQAFQSCTSLTSITIPESVTSIGSFAFYGCTSLTKVYFADPKGWSYNGSPVSDDLSDPAVAAKLLSTLSGEFTKE